MIIVVGSINLDLIANVERIPATGETVSGTGFRTAPGGKGANQALAAARAGLEVRMHGAVGRDSFAGPALALLHDGGLDISHVAETDAATGVALIMVDPKGRNVIAVSQGANGTVAVNDDSALGLRAGDVVVLQQEIPTAANRAALRAARVAGAVSVLNTAPHRQDCAGLLAEADFVVANESEFDAYAAQLGLAGVDRAARMRDFVRSTGRSVVVTLGAEGVLAEGPGGGFAVPALAVEAVDTVAAGDTFCGYLAAGLAVGLPLSQAIGRAVIAASLACTREGAQPSIPFASEVDAVRLT